jgi:DNA-directed RNA polymerase specialized sigma24 family protein
MRVPNGMTEQQVIDQIQIVCERIAPKYIFYGYTKEDIMQESFIICVEALNRYEEGRPLENFLSVNLSNRLKTFMRDNYFIGNSNEARKKLAQPSQLEYEDKIIDDANENTYDGLDIKDMINAIDKHIPASVRMDYLKIINDIYITKQRREEIIDIIKSILQEHGYHENGTHQ